MADPVSVVFGGLFVLGLHIVVVTVFKYFDYGVFKGW